MKEKVVRVRVCGSYRLHEADEEVQTRPHHL
jgi:hypothetical protein